MQQKLQCCTIFIIKQVSSIPWTYLIPYQSLSHRLFLNAGSFNAFFHPKSTGFDRSGLALIKSTQTQVLSKRRSKITVYTVSCKSSKTQWGYLRRILYCVRSSSRNPEKYSKYPDSSTLLRELKNVRNVLNIKANLVAVF